MASKDSFKRRGKSLKSEIKRAFGEARTRAGDADVHNVNLAGRANVVVSKNVGQGGSSQGASAHQKVRIRQQGGKTYEEYEITETPH